MKNIKNPLTIVGIFAGLAEAAGTIVLPMLSESMQGIFVWYVILFPVLLVLSFFITWNFNPSVLYPPGDYANQNDYIGLITKRNAKRVDDINNLVEEKVKSAIIEMQSKAKLGSVDIGEISKVLNKKLENIRSEIDNKKNEAESDNSRYSLRLKKKIIDLLSTHETMSIRHLSHLTLVSGQVLLIAIYSLMDEGIIDSIVDANGRQFFLIKQNPE